MANVRGPGGGRKPKPTALKLLEGNLGKRPLPLNEPTPRTLASYPAPEWLGQTAKKVWEYLAIELAMCGLLTSIDITKFSRYCDAWEKWKQARDFLALNGDSYEIFQLLEEPDPKDPTKTIKRKLVTGHRPYPQVNIYSRMHAMLCDIESDFGMSPVARTRIQVLISNPNGGEQPPDPFEYD